MYVRVWACVGVNRHWRGISNACDDLRVSPFGIAVVPRCNDVPVWRLQRYVHITVRLCIYPRVNDFSPGENSVCAIFRLARSVLCV